MLTPVRENTVFSASHQRKYMSSVMPLPPYIRGNTPIRKNYYTCSKLLMPNYLSHQTNVATIRMISHKETKRVICPNCEGQKKISVWVESPADGPQRGQNEMHTCPFCGGDGIVECEITYSKIK